MATAAKRMQGRTYATRSQTVIVATRDGQVRWRERTRPVGDSDSEWPIEEFSFHLSSAPSGSGPQEDCGEL